MNDVQHVGSLCKHIHTSVYTSGKKSAMKNVLKWYISR